MTIGPNWVVLDTNIWIFGLRHQPEQLACAQVLQHLPQLHVKIPRQVLLELQGLQRARTACVGAVAGATPPASAGRRIVATTRPAFATALSGSAS